MSVADSASGPISCPQCAAANTADRKFCGECGSPLTAVAADGASYRPVDPVYTPPVPPPIPPPVKPRGKAPPGLWIGMGLAAVALVAVVYFYGRRLPAHKVVIGTSDEIYYSGNASEQDARALGQALQGTGYFSDHGVTVVLAKEDGGATVSFVTRDGSATDAATVAAFAEVSRGIAPTVGGLPMKVRLVTKNLSTRLEMYID